MKIIIAGDFVITDQFYYKKLMDKSVQDLLYKADHRIVNLEAPITNDIKKNKAT